MKPEDCERLREGIVETLEAGLRGGGASMDDYLRRARRARHDAGRVPRPHARGRALPALRRRDPEDRGRGPLDLLLSLLPAASSPPAAPAGAAAAERREGGRVSEAIGPPEGFAVGHWTDSRGRDRLQRGDPAGREPGRGGRPRRRAGHARDRRDRPARRHQRGDRGAAHRRQRLRAGGGRRGDCAGWRRTGGDTRPRRGWCRSSPRPSSTTSRRAIRGRARARMPATRPARPRPPGVPERGRVGAGTGAAVGKIRGRERSVRGGDRLRGGAERPRRDGRRARGRQRLRRRDRRGRAGAGGAAGARRGRRSRPPS